MSAMKTAKIIEKVVGHGPGKYKFIELQKGGKTNEKNNRWL